MPASKEIHVGVAATENIEIVPQVRGGRGRKILFRGRQGLPQGQQALQPSRSSPRPRPLTARPSASTRPTGPTISISDWPRRNRPRPRRPWPRSARRSRSIPKATAPTRRPARSWPRPASFAGARTFYEKAAGLSPDDPDGQFNLGVCLVNLGESEAALPRFEKAVEPQAGLRRRLLPDGEPSIIGQNKVPEAKAALEKFLALAPEHEKAAIARQLLDFLKK